LWPWAPRSSSWRSRRVSTGGQHVEPRLTVGPQIGRRIWLGRGRSGWGWQCSPRLGYSGRSCPGTPSNGDAPRRPQSGAPCIWISGPARRSATTPTILTGVPRPAPRDQHREPGSASMRSDRSGGRLSHPTWRAWCVLMAAPSTSGGSDASTVKAFRRPGPCTATPCPRPARGVRCRDAAQRTLVCTMCR
jgi:hypothetical protein